jgi:uncharacterized membrane protein
MYRFAIAALLLTPLAAPAHAGLTVCNEASETASVSIGYKGEEDWTSEGWWNIDPGDCVTVIAGDLKNRYYYWRASSLSNIFEHQEYYFCTQTEVYTIVGDTDCDARGFDRSRFNEVEVGGAADFTLTLTADGPAPAPDPAPGPAPVPETIGDAPGTHGEPYTVRGLFSHCDVRAETTECAVIFEDWLYLARSIDATPRALLNRMNDELPLNAPVEIEGDIISHEGATAKVTIRRFSRAGQDPYADMRDRLQGLWQAEDDAAFRMLFHGSYLDETFVGLSMSPSFYTIADTCEGAAGAGPVLVMRDRRDGTRFCWVVRALTGERLVLHSVGGVGDMRYRRAD